MAAPSGISHQLFDEVFAALLMSRRETHSRVVFAT
jgi:hypothetical protein